MRLNFDTTIDHIKRHLLFYIILAVFLAFNIPVFKLLIEDWIRDGNYSHGFFIIPISIFLIYRSGNLLVFPAPRSMTGMVLFVFGCAGMILGAAANEFFSSRASMILSLTGVTLFYLGWANFKKVWFAFFFLLFMIPLPAVIYYSATLPLQLFATKATVAILHIFDLPSVRHGNIIFLPNFKLEVAEACSGLRSLVTLMALGALYGYLTLQGTIRPLTLFIMTVPVAIAVNIFRLVITAFGAYAISPKVAESFLHELSGLLVFIIALVAIIIIGSILGWKKSRS